MVRAETKRASRNARFKRTRNALEHIHSECVRSRTRTTFLSLSFTKKRKEREARDAREAAIAAGEVFSDEEKEGEKESEEVAEESIEQGVG